MTRGGFKERVLRVVKMIPKGRVASYKDVARAAGSPNASRAVGNIMMDNHDPDVPCHRVIRSDGKLGGYNGGGTKEKERLLKLEKAIH